MKKIFSLVMSGILSLGIFYSNCYASPNDEPKQRFTPAEDKQLIELVKIFGEKSWEQVSLSMENKKSPRQCRERYKYYLNPNINSLPWTAEEDQLLIQKVSELGCRWKNISRFFDNRTHINIKNRYRLLVRHQFEQRQIKYKSTSDNPSRTLSIEDLFKKLDDLEFSILSDCYEWNF